MSAEQRSRPVWLFALGLRTGKHPIVGLGIRGPKPPIQQDPCQLRIVPMEVSFSVVGDAREMHPLVRDEVYRIGYEAIRNACTHSRARRSDVALSYAKDLNMRVSDNGVGIDPSIADQGRDGHFGLQGMRERAARIGGKLNVVSSANSGTEITVVVPAEIVFKNSNTSPFERLHSILKRMSGTSNSH
jgi:hypothetical protein